MVSFSAPARRRSFRQYLVAFLAIACGSAACASEQATRPNRAPEQVGHALSGKSAQSSPEPGHGVVSTTAPTQADRRVPSSTRPPLVKDSVNYHVVRRSEALRWWPYRPLLVLSSLPRSGWRLIHVAQSPAGGTAGDPHSPFAALMLIYSYPPGIVENANYEQILEAGGVTLRSTFLSETPVRGGTEEAGNVFHVRGHVARMREFMRPSANVDYRIISWSEPLPHGGVLYWELGMSPHRYSKDDAISFAQNLQEDAGVPE